MKWLDRILGVGGSTPIPEDIEVESMLSAFLSDPGSGTWTIDVRATTTGAALLALPPDRFVRVIRSVLRDDAKDAKDSVTGELWTILNRREKLVGEICRRALPLNVAEARALLSLLSAAQARTNWLRYSSLVKAIARSAMAGGWLSEVEVDFRNFQESLAKSSMSQYAALRSALKDLNRIIDQASGNTVTDVLIRSDAWGEQAQAALEGMAPPNRKGWQEILNFCAGAKGSAPNAKWLKSGAEVIDRFGRREFAEVACTWLGLLSQSSTSVKTREPHYAIIEEENGDLLKGLVWLLVHVPNDQTADALADTALAAFKKIPNWGARSVKVGNACLQSLKSLPGLTGARRLAVLRARIKLPSQTSAVEKALRECAARLNLSVAETEELAVPDHGFVEGRQVISFGDMRVELTIDGTSVTIAWFGSDGKPRKSEPAQIKSEFAEERKAMKRLIADTEKTLMAVRDRLERLPLEQREWAVDVWRERYHDHPVVGALARRLIWRFRQGNSDAVALWVNAQWRDESGNTVDISGMTVSLWHPIFASVESVRKWRTLLALNGVMQPFKQAHREIYVLTDAERNTRIYSNRFAAHVLRQHQFASLCTARGWRYRLQGAFDSHNTPTMALPKWRLAAELWVDSPDGADDGDLSSSGIYLHVLSDQVRFKFLPGEDGLQRDLNEPMPLEDVPPIVFSEVMRDVDLFVGVASVGNDPTWSDGGPDGRFRTYWHQYSFGELSVAAQNRTEIIAELLPRLALRDRAHIDGKFLVVKGALRTYKIHIGSGNILMEPNDQYLCIVPDRTANKQGLQLPFEGDVLLSVILSKAFLLARDNEIKDPTITAQIGRK